MAMTKEQLLEQMEMDQMIAQAEMAGDPYIQDDRVQLSAPTGGTGDDMYRDMGAIDPSQMNTGAGDMGGIEPETLSDQELNLAIDFADQMPPEERGNFFKSLMENPMVTFKSVMDTLGQVFGGGQEPTPSMGALSGISDGAPSLEQMQRDDMLRYDPPDLRRQEEILMRNMTER